MTKNIAVLSLVLVVGCMPEFPAKNLPPDDLDAGPGDASSVDAEQSVDSSAELDSGNVSDSGNVLDEGSVPDSDHPSDAGHVPDAGDSDLGHVPDAGSLDSGNVSDVGAPDAGNPADLGHADTGIVADAGGRDLGSGFDVGQPDVGYVLDEGTTFDAGEGEGEGEADAGLPDGALAEAGQPECVNDDDCPPESYGCECQGNTQLCTLILHQCLDGWCQFAMPHFECAHGCADSHCNPEPECEGNLDCEENMSCHCAEGSHVCQLEHALCVDNVCAREETREDCVFGCSPAGCNECLVDDDCPLEDTCRCQGDDLVCQDPDQRCVRGDCQIIRNSTPCEFGCEAQTCVIPECRRDDDCPTFQTCDVLAGQCTFNPDEIRCQFDCAGGGADNIRLWIPNGSLPGEEQWVACNSGVFEATWADICQENTPFFTFAQWSQMHGTWSPGANATVVCNNPNFSVTPPRDANRAIHGNAEVLFEGECP